jgi:DNA polymerase-3 subunit chi
MKLDFYLTTRRPVERVIGAVAVRARAEGQRMLIVAKDEALLDRIDKALWHYRPEAYLAHGRASEPHAERQPLLLSTDCTASNGARVVAFADGHWRDEAEDFDRALLFFDEAGRENARAAWRTFDAREDIEREFRDLDPPAGAKA